MVAASPDRVLRLVLYYDVFHHPLTVDELAWLAAAPAEDAVARLVAEGRVERHGRHVCRVGAGSDVPRRVARTRDAERLWRAARPAARLLSRLPWVRGVMVTGGLSKRSAAAGGDVDFLLLVEPGRVWTTRSMLQAARRAMPDRARAWFCTNYLLATDRLALDQRNAFTAMELVTAVPMWGREACEAFLLANRWAEAEVPGWRSNLARARAAPAAPPPGLVERGLDRVASALERRSQDAWTRFWDRKYHWLDDATRARRFRRQAHVSTNHLHDFQDYVLREYHGRLRASGLDPGAAPA